MTTILIADDDPMLRAIAVQLLEDRGYTLLEAEDGDQALAIMDKQRVDLIVLDMLMPNKDGLETIMEIRKRFSGVRILGISSGGSMDINTLLKPAMIFGADRVMAKPLRISTFEPTITEMLQSQSTATSPFS